MATRAQGFVPVRQFQHKAKVRREGSDSRQTQHLKLTAWDHVAAVKHKVDRERVNWTGLLYNQPEFDPRPRIRMGEARLQELIAKVQGARQ